MPLMTVFSVPFFKEKLWKYIKCFIVTPLNELKRTNFNIENFDSKIISPDHRGQSLNKSQKY